MTSVLTGQSSVPRSPAVEKREKRHSGSTSTPREMALLTVDEQAHFHEFYVKTSGAIFRKSFRMCRGHEADAHDALRRTYLQALRNWSTISILSEAQRHGWLARTLTNEVLQIWRQPHRSRETGV